MSELGKVLFFNSIFKKRNKIFKILIWKDGKFLERRHIKYFTSDMYNLHHIAVMKVTLK